MTWPVLPLADLLAVPLANGRSVPTEAGGFPVLRLTALRNGHIDLRERKDGAWTRADAERSLVRSGDFLVSRGNGTLDLVGRGGLVAAVADAVAYPDTMIRVRPDVQRLDPRFLALAWNAPDVRRQIEKSARTTAGIYKVNQSHLGAVTLPVPPLEEQRHLVDLLEGHLSRLAAAGTYLAASRRRLTALDRSCLDAHFGGTDVPLADLIDDVSAGKSFGAANAPAALDEWGIVKVSAMTWGRFNPNENKAVTADRVDPRFEIRSGDLLVSRANTAEYVGASVLVGDVRPKLLLSDKSLRITPRAGVDREWLWRALQAPSARRQITALATGTKDSMRNISQVGLREILLPRADETAQRGALDAFTQVADATAALRSEIWAGEKRLGLLRRSLLAAAFSGRLTGSDTALSAAEEMIGA